MESGWGGAISKRRRADIFERLVSSETLIRCQTGSTELDEPLESIITESTLDQMQGAKNALSDYCSDKNSIVHLSLLPRWTVAKTIVQRTLGKWDLNCAGAEPIAPCHCLQNRRTPDGQRLTRSAPRSS
ncbi:hypothetical protein T4A_3514 [Trichinella pseudospiralis]|uniref:Uncharacterized protein n=1 Tax=Trichinella pseudospiralis TaxID=6337 RepID=A0A0V1E0H9_TRIPS|nr:hypothetical protein T4A_3514 [Trichinella pseudospiralis]